MQAPKRSQRRRDNDDCSRRNPAPHAPSSYTCSAFIRSISVATLTSLLRADRRAPGSSVAANIAVGREFGDEQVRRQARVETRIRARAGMRGRYAFVSASSRERQRDADKTTAAFVLATVERLASTAPLSSAVERSPASSAIRVGVSARECFAPEPAVWSMVPLRPVLAAGLSVATAGADRSNLEAVRGCCIAPAEGQPLPHQSAWFPGVPQRKPSVHLETVVVVSRQAQGYPDDPNAPECPPWAFP